jgi:hypothetical protein
MDAKQIIQTKTTSGIAFGLKVVGVLGDGPIIEKTDGVVAYESAHIEGVASEKVIRSGHSTQSHPETIEEVRLFVFLSRQDRRCTRPFEHAAVAVFLMAD